MEDDSYEKSFEICEKSDFKEYLKDEKSLVFRHYDSPFEKDVPFDFLKEAISKNKQLSFSTKEIKKISYEWIRNNTCKEENCQYHKECLTCVFDSLEEYSEEKMDDLSLRAISESFKTTIVVYSNNGDNLKEKVFFPPSINPREEKIFFAYYENNYFPLEFLPKVPPENLCITSNQPEKKSSDCLARLGLVEDQEMNSLFEAMTQTVLNNTDITLVEEDEIHQCSTWIEQNLEIPYDSNCSVQEYINARYE
jgi:hypothetical protein